MPYSVVLTKDVEVDLEDIYDYMLEHDSVGKAVHVLDQLLKVAESLANFPEKRQYTQRATRTRHQRI